MFLLITNYTIYLNISLNWSFILFKNSFGSLSVRSLSAELRSDRIGMNLSSILFTKSDSVAVDAAVFLLLFFSFESNKRYSTSFTKFLLVLLLRVVSKEEEEEEEEEEETRLESRSLKY